MVSQFESNDRTCNSKQNYLPVKMPFQLMNVEKEYEKDPNLKREDIKALSEWMDKQPHLPKIPEQQLILFLHSCYYSQEAAKTAIDNFFTVRTLCPELFGAPTLESLKYQLTVGSLTVLPKRTPEGYAVILMKLMDPIPEHYNFHKQVNLGDLAMMLYLHLEGTCNGILPVFDMKGVAFGHLARMNLTAMKKHMFYIQEAAPLRIKGLHYINLVPFADKLVGLAKPFMKKELVDLIHFHNDTMETFYKFVPKEILPKDYGGEAPPHRTLHDENAKKMLDHMDFYQWMDTLKVDESKRLGKNKNVGDIFGVDGTFKKLEVD